MAGMEQAELEIHTALPEYSAHNGSFVRKFGSYEGDLVLVTEHSPPPEVDQLSLAATMRDLNGTIEDDFIFDYCGTFVVPDDENPDENVLKSLVFFPEGGILSGLIFSDVKLGWSFRIQIAINLARVLCHLHNNNIIHNDLHAQAVAFDSEWTCKLLDMFYCVRVEDIFSSHNLTAMKNDSAYAAPEVHAEGVCSAASDIYSFGICLFEICSRVLVTSIHKNSALYRESAADVILDHLPSSIPESLRELIRQMLCVEAEYRPTIEDVLDWLESLLIETSLEDEPPLPPLPKLPFPDRRKSSRMMRSPGSPRKQSDNIEFPVAESSDSSPDRRGGRGGGYAISKTDADRLKSIAKAKRESEIDGISDHINQPPPPPSSDDSSEISNVLICVANETEPPTLSGYLQLKADNLPFYKNKFFFFKENNLVWCSDIKLREQPERLHYFDLSHARIVDKNSPLSIHVEIDPTLTLEPLPGQPRKKLFRSSRVRDHLLIKFASHDLSRQWKNALEQEIVVNRCKMCRVKLEVSTERTSNPAFEGKEMFCSPMCANYFVATTARGMQLSGKSLQYSNSLRLSQTDMQALDKQLIARRNPKTWKRILKKEGGDLSHGIAKEVVEVAKPLPQSVEEWLKSLGQENLLEIFVASGYDCIGHIIMASLHEDDLNFLKIEDKKVRLLLMTKSRSLAETYVKNKNFFVSQGEIPVV